MVNQEVASAVPVSRSMMMISQINKSFQLYQQLYHCITVSAVSAVSLYQLTLSRLAVSGGWRTLPTLSLSNAYIVMIVLLQVSAS